MGITSGAFLKAIGAAGLDPSISTILTNKVASNLNQTPPSVTFEKLLAEIGITLSPVEKAAWKRRNVAAHGGELDLDSYYPDDTRDEAPQDNFAQNCAENHWRE